MSRIKEVLNKYSYKVEYRDDWKLFNALLREDRDILDFFDELGNKFRLIHVFGIDRGYKNIELNYFIEYRGDSILNIVLKRYLSKDNLEATSIANKVKHALWPERECMELLGVKFNNHPDPRHLFLPYDWPEESKDFTKIDMSNSKISLISIGPYHPALIEGIFLRVKLSSDKIVEDVDIKPGFSHRGIMRLAEERNYWQNIVLIERICGICSMAHTTCYVNVVERLFNVNPPLRAKVIRVLVSELNRIHSHLLVLGLLADIAGFTNLFLDTWKIREHAMNSIEIICGNRASEGINTIGGVRRDLSEAKIKGVKNELEKIIRGLPQLYDRFNGIGVRDKLEDVGKISYASAVKWGVVGPPARGAGVKRDVRKDFPYDAYNEFPWNLVSENSGDVFSRVLVWFGELKESLDLCNQCLDFLEKNNGEIVNESFLPVNGEAYMRVEAPRGDLFYYIVGGKPISQINMGGVKPISLVIKTPTYTTIPVLNEILIGSRVEEIPIILGSLDPCIACLDRAIIIDKSGRKYSYNYISMSEFSRKCSRLRDE